MEGSGCVNKRYDLEQRTLEFSKRILNLAKVLKKQSRNTILIDQCIRSGTSIGANYREANDSLGKKDFLHRMRISRKEAKETTYWLELIAIENSDLASSMNSLIKESVELTKILSSIINISEKKKKQI